MLARCARCQGTFTTDRYGTQTCPHCGSELILADPAAPQSAPQVPPPPQPGQSDPPPAGSPPPPVSYPAPPVGAGWSPVSPPAPPAPVELPAPFADRQGRNPFVAYFSTWKLALIEPQKFFAHVRLNQSGAALLFALCTFVSVSILQALFAAAYLSQMQAVFRQMGTTLPPEVAQLFQSVGAVGPALLLVGAVAGVVADFVVLFTMAAVLHLLLLLFRAGSRGFDATLTVVGYSTGLALIGLVPCGGFVALVWLPIVLIIGLAAAHRTTRGKAAAAVLAPGVLLVCCCCMGGSMMAGALKGLIPQHGGGTTL